MVVICNVDIGAGDVGQDRSRVVDEGETGSRGAVERTGYSWAARFIGRSRGRRTILTFSHQPEEEGQASQAPAGVSRC